ncbi:hypothetical protein Srubr_67240 [Streptomyces rubradiris]|uniref:Secreted protein n=1 Tax=Streptomyces rubradiris TaxID=285531 RepID=A0ABQ3RLY5_STRRR|nr:hypothetical protein GCM10018792_21830 [Streptomyces rubradiris]GHI56878.1 hypothetical protein Srubr_67240 [Streptomyces rubradiris]
MGFRVRAGLAAGPAGGAAPAAGAAGHAEAALFGRRGAVFLPGPAVLRPVLLRRGECHTGHRIQRVRRRVTVLPSRRYPDDRGPVTDTPAWG